MESFELQSIESNLIDLRGQLIRSVELITRNKNREDGPLPQDLDDQSIDLETYDVIDGLDRLERLELTKIEGALKKIKNGTFGICAKCGEKIKERRLKALPYATTCIDCASETSW